MPAENLIIKGNNLIALHSLAKQFKGKVKLIYIDPPYNTENDSFKYNDKFTRSTWLTFMKNRLQIAKDLLASDGSIFIQIDWHQAHYLKILLDDIFGEKNFINEIIWHYSSGGDYKNCFAKKHDTIFWYSKSGKYNYYPQNKMVGEIRGNNKKNNMKKNVDVDGRVYFSIKSAGKEYRYYEDDLVVPDDVWDISILQQKDPERMGFNSQKPEKLLARIIGALTNESDIVLDYHLGSGTTAAVAHKMNRQYIGIEQMDYIETLAVERLKKVIDGEQGGISKAVNWQGGGEFVYAELTPFNETAKQQILASENSDNIKTLFNELCERYFLKYNVSVNEFSQIIEEPEFQSLPLDEQKQMLLEMLDLNQMYVSLSEMDDAQFAGCLNDNDKALSRAFYQVEKKDGE